ncbi:MAG: hypothetical protein ABJD07_11965 [Gemmatimonadaceae bacterium]
MSADHAAAGRRTFLGTLGALAGLAIVRPRDAHATVVSRAGADAAAQNGWDLTWLDALTGKHKQVFDFGADLSKGSPTRVVRNYLNAHRDVYGLNPPQVNTVVGIARAQFPVNVGDAAWVKYKLGERWKVKDPKTNDWSQHNLFIDDVKELQARGTLFWQCNNALAGISHDIADDMKVPFETVRADIIASFNPGVRLVPAHTMALGLCQERGCTYESLV